MKVILYMAITANGMIAKEDNNVDWVSDESWKSYTNHVKTAGCAIIGKKTYELMPEDEFVEGCRYIIVTNENLTKKSPSVEFVNADVKIIDQLEKEGVKEVCICGGGMTNTLFNQLIDEIYLDVEPIILGKGIKLFSEEEFETELELIDTNKLSNNTIQLHYKVKRAS